MVNFDFFDIDGSSLSYEEWADLQSSPSYKIVNQESFTFLKEEVKISTVWLGMDYGFGGPIKIFETMIFGGPHDQYQERYSTYEEAQQGHLRAKALVQGFDYAQVPPTVVEEKEPEFESEWDL